MRDEEENPMKELMERRMWQDYTKDLTAKTSPDIGGPGAEIHIHETDWTRVEGVIGGGAVLTAVLSTAGISLGQAIGTGFGLVMLVDFVIHRWDRMQGDK